MDGIVVICERSKEFRSIYLLLVVNDLFIIAPDAINSVHCTCKYICDTHLKNSTLWSFRFVKQNDAMRN